MGKTDENSVLFARILYNFLYFSQIEAWNHFYRVCLIFSFPGSIHMIYIIKILFFHSEGVFAKFAARVDAQKHILLSLRSRAYSKNFKQP